MISTSSQLPTQSDTKPVLHIRRAAGGHGRSYRVATPYRHPEFVPAFKALVGGTWHKQAGEWFIPEAKLSAAIELLEYWFAVRVTVESAPAAPVAAPAPVSKPRRPLPVLEQTYYVEPLTGVRYPASRIAGWDV